MPRRYAHAATDVFTDRPFGGNPLAAEFVYSETTFVLAPADPAHTARVRIFTPRAEMPFAAHPNVGTAYVLAQQILARRHAMPTRFLFEEAAGMVPVRLLRDVAAVVEAEPTAAETLTQGSPIEIAPVAACLGLTPADIRVDAHPPLVASFGFPAPVVELTSPATAQAPILPRMRGCCPATTPTRSSPIPAVWTRARPTPIFRPGCSLPLTGSLRTRQPAVPRPPRPHSSPLGRRLISAGGACR
jgi:hypothetical protein